MSGTPLALIWELLARDKASPAFLRVAGAADKAAASTARATKSMGGSAARMGAVGAKLTKGATLPLLGLAAVSVDQAAKYQRSLNTIQVATDRTDRQMAAGSKGLLSIAKATGTTLGGLSDSFYVASKAGGSVAKALETTRAAAEGAKAEGADLGTVTDALTSIMASYGKTLQNPIAAMNQIIKGAGLAKTTTQDFAGSLSNIVPIASALHISFAQVAGAIATMTQHGETAQRATDNLANLTTNLAGQNNVAAQALGQLGINTIDLSRNLGKRGLTGSLNLVLNAIAKHSKAGLVVTDAFRHSATATASLRQELDAMPPVLAKNARAFDSGKQSYKDFYAFAKSLGGQAYQLAKGFITTEGTAKGFNAQLKSGNSTTSTLARTLQKALGGVTGMRTALMLSGASAKTFATDTKEISKVALNAGADVLGWGKTQNTLAVKMDKAKASLQVVAVEIGSKLIPAAGKIVDKFSQVVHWFENLSGTQNTIAKWGIGVLFALGPVLSIGAKLTTVGRGMMTAATMFTTSDTRIAGAMRGITAALGGAAIGFAVGTLTKNSSAAVKAVGVLGSAAAGAALGSAGGPLGAVIGGIAGGVSALATQYLSAGDDAQKSGNQARAALRAQRKAADDLLGSLQSVDGAYRRQYRTQVAQQLQQKGALDLASKLHVSGKDLLQASLGSPQAYKAVRSQLGSFLAAGHEDFAGQAGKLLRLLDTFTGGAKRAENEFTRIAKATGQGIVPTKQLAAGTKALGKELKGTGTTLNEATAYGARNTEVIRENLAYLRKQAVQQLNAGKGASAVATGFDKSTAALKKFLKQMGFKSKGPDGLDALFKKLAHPPKFPTITPNVDPTPAGEKIAKLQDRIRAIKQGKVPGVDVYTAEGHAKLVSLQAQLDRLRSKTVTVTVLSANAAEHAAKKARGGFVFGRGTATSDSIDAKLSNGEFVVRARAAARNRTLLESINKGTRGFAAGGHVGVEYAPRRQAGGAVSRGGGTRTVRVVVDLDPNGKWQQVVRDIVLDDSDLDATIGRMR